VGDIEQVGIGLFVAVLVDATIVRCLLVPADTDPTGIGRPATIPGSIRMQLDMTEVTKVYQGGITAGGATPDRSISACSPGSLIKGSGTIHGDVM
jgi:hypothetical protein